MDGKTFNKFAKDSHLIDKSFPSVDVDLIFAKVKINKIERRITFDEFIHGISLISEKKGLHFDQLMAHIAETNQGPVLKATKTD